VDFTDGAKYVRETDTGEVLGGCLVATTVVEVKK
jgi:hypothetical protein